MPRAVLVSGVCEELNPLNEHRGGGRDKKKKKKIRVR